MVVMARKQTLILGPIQRKRTGRPIVVRQAVAVLGCSGIILTVFTVYFGHKMGTAHFVKRLMIPRAGEGIDHSEQQLQPKDLGHLRGVPAGSGQAQKPKDLSHVRGVPAGSGQAQKPKDLSHLRGVPAGSGEAQKPKDLSHLRGVPAGSGEAQKPKDLSHLWGVPAGSGQAQKQAWNITGEHAAPRPASKIPLLRPQNIKVQVFPDWPQSRPKDSLFLVRVYIYSAFLALHTPSSPTPRPRSVSQVHIVAFQEGRRLLPLKCCLLLPGQQPVEGPLAQLDFSKNPMNQVDPPLRRHGSQIGVVYRCHLPYSAQQLREAHITLISTSCPVKSNEYLRIQEPELRPGHVGLCAKVLFGHELDPRWLVEWFELQRLLGVDKVVLFDLNHTEGIDRVLRYYQDLGLLTRLPYKLPDRPWGRDIRRGTNHDNFGDEQVLTTWDCRLRLAGYDFVLALDLDEVVVTRNFFYLKPFFRAMFKARDDLAAIYFRVQFFVEEWGPVDRTSPLHVLSYLNSTVPWEARFKYVYIPAKTHQALTHHMMPFPGYTSKRAQPWEGTLFHYRKCPFDSCGMTRVTDKTLTPYRKALEPRVLAAWKEVGLP